MSTKKRNVPGERDVEKELEGILRANFSEDELVTGELAKTDDLLEEGKSKCVDNVARFLKRIDDKMRRYKQTKINRRINMKLFKSRKRVLEELCATQRARIEELEKKLAERDDECRLYLNEAARVAEECNALKAENQSLKADNERLIGVLNEVNEALVKLRARVVDLHSSLCKSDREVKENES